MVKPKLFPFNGKRDSDFAIALERIFLRYLSSSRVGAAVMLLRAGTTTIGGSNTSTLAATSCVPTAADFCKGDSIIFTRVPLHLASARSCLSTRERLQIREAEICCSPALSPCLINSTS
ncbi:hypothetical protein MRB53_017406 [Persea americana]|uniref:Uncharacterized protein n=1 Tax=Persea americana TaxID=3435 RepID=A0ACC2M6C3_PERAE|nr:hypothetical protein MRB53_017406 [Persea americana]